MNNKYEGRGLDEQEVDKLQREDDYNNAKAIKEAERNRDVKRLNVETFIIGASPYVVSILFIGAFLGLWLTSQRTAALVLLTNAISALSAYALGIKNRKKFRSKTNKLL